MRNPPAAWWFARASRIAFLQQEFDVDPDRTVRQELFQAFGSSDGAQPPARGGGCDGLGEQREDLDHLDDLIHERTPADPL